MQQHSSSKIRNGIAFLSLICLSSFSIAHSPYLLPNVFEPGDDGVVTLDAAMGEYFFVPDRVFTGSDFKVDLPDNSSQMPDNLVEFKTRTVLEHTLEMDGTYRFSTGWRIGDIVTSYELDGRTRRMRGADAVIPEGGKILEVYRSYTKAETYLTRGAPTATVLTPTGEGLEFVMESHPNELFAGEAVTLKASLDGIGEEGVAVDVYLAARQAENGPSTYSLVSNAEGSLMFTPELPGIYILKSRHLGTVVDLGSPANRYTYTLVLEVTE